MDTLIQLAVSFFVGMLTQAMISDNGAVILCRACFLELEKALGELERLQTFPQGGEVIEANKINQINGIILQLESKYAELLVGLSLFQWLFDSSAKSILRWKKAPSEPQNVTSFIAVELRELWIPALPKIKRFLYANLFWRILYRMCEVLTGILKFVCIPLLKIRSLKLFNSNYWVFVYQPPIDYALNRPADDAGLVFLKILNKKNDSKKIRVVMGDYASRNIFYNLTVLVLRDIGAQRFDELKKLEIVLIEVTYNGSEEAPEIVWELK